ncbi:hypothetical protein IWW48_001190 [Coemansia sp. RSA 1200]|nr:hypothetical protein IWW48_001190 [Coemansia sp. RSA 1200]
MRTLFLCVSASKQQVKAGFRQNGRAKRWTTTDAAAAAAADSGGEQKIVIFDAISGRAVRMLKFMSLTGSVAACTATGVTWVQHLQDKVEETDMGPHSLILASVVSLVSTVCVTKMFGPFVTRVTMLPAAKPGAVHIDKHGLPTFDSILSTASRQRTPVQQQHRHLSLSGRVTSDTELVFETPGLLGFTTRHTRLRVRDLEPSGKRSRTWNIAAAARQRLKENGIKPPINTFTILWKSAKDSQNKQLMEEINTIVGASS